MAHYRALFHLNEGNKAWADMVLRNIENLLADLDSEEVEVAQVVIVRSGVGELVRGQAEGWAYIRP